MALPRFSEDVCPVTDLKTKASALVAQVQRSRRPLLLTCRGRGLAVLLDLGEYERLAERAAFIAGVQEGVAAAQCSTLHDHAEATAILDRFGKQGG